MQIIFLGPPASGKGTQSTLIVEKYNIPHISTGDILRKAIKDRTEEGILAEKLINDGNFVPDDIMINIVKKRLKEKDCENGFLLDGFPRTVDQAEALDEYLKENCISLDRVINIEVADEEIMARAINRRTCENSECKEIYNLRDNPPKIEGICDKCGSNLFQRADDNEETVKNRWMVYHNQTEPLIEFYTKKDLVATIIGQENINDTIALVKAELAK